ncbi:MAG: biopolymer transporter ExbD [Bdellovibrionales bacterium]|nr:biopolymer transporter ExbD [Bdellovibrionales bacterium]
MAHVEDSSGNRRQSNVELNLVPFIDLMSVLITFLLITAVWTQVSMIKLGSSIYGKQTTDETPPPPPRADVPFRLDVKEAGFRIIIGTAQHVIPKVNNEYDKNALLEKLKQIKQAYPDKVDCVITVEEQLKYDYLIQGMDMLLQAGFPAVSVATGGAE